MPRKTLRTAVMAALFCCSAAMAQEAQSPENFATSMAETNMYEIAAAKLAETHAKTEGARDYATSVKAAHEKMRQDLEAAATAEKIAQRTELGKPLTEKLSALEGAAPDQFDAAYLSNEISVHQAATDIAEKYDQSGPAGPLQAYAKAYRNALRMHLTRAQGLASHP